MSIKVTLFFTYGVSLNTWGKSGLLKREVMLYAKLMSKYDIEVQFLTYGNNADFQWIEDVENITILPIYSRIPYRRLKILRFFQTALIPWYFRKELKNADIYKTNQMLGGWVAVISKIFFKKPLIVRCGYEIYDAYKFQQKSYVFMWLIWLMSWATYRFSDLVHLATLRDKEVVKHFFGVPSKKIEIRPNWIDTEVFNNFNGIRKDKILFVGRLTEQKNIPLLLDSLRDIGVSMDIVGSGHLKSDLKQYADNIGVDINFLGSVPNSQMSTIYNSYSIYVLCSPYEGNPKTLLEAMSCGCSVIGTNIPGISSIITHKIDGFLVEEDSSSLQSAILELFSDKKLRLLLGKNAEEYIQINNSLESAVIREFNAYVGLHN